MLDYHLHLWPHESSTTWLSLDQIADYCEMAAQQGVTQLAMTEHLHRFTQAADLVGRFWEDADDRPEVRAELAAYFDHHARSDLDAYVTLCESAKAAGLPVVTGMEVDYYRGQMDEVADLLEGYPFDVLLGSVHWIGAWQFDSPENAVHMAEWEVRDVDACWDAYTACMEELAGTQTCDVLAHPDLIKIVGRIPDAPEEWWDRIAEAAGAAGMSAEVSSAGWFKPVDEQYPAMGLLDRFLANGVTLTTASDAHRLERVAARADDLRAILATCGVTSLASYEERQRVDVRAAQAGVWSCCERRRAASHCLRSLRRSSSEVPPHTPDSWLVASAKSRHGVIASHDAHTRFAAAIWSRAEPVEPIGKNMSGSLLRQAATARQSSMSQSNVRFHVSAIAPSLLPRIVKPFTIYPLRSPRKGRSAESCYKSVDLVSRARVRRLAVKWRVRAFENPQPLQ
jgi:histidinol-phosphatase (PHP family)